MKKLITTILLLLWAVSAFAEIELIWQADTPNILPYTPSKEQIQRGEQVKPKVQITNTEVNFYTEDGTLKNKVTLSDNEDASLCADGDLVRIDSRNNRWYPEEGEGDEFSFYSLEGEKILSLNYDDDDTIDWPITSPNSNIIIFQTSELGGEGEPATAYFYNKEGKLLNTYLFPISINSGDVTFSKSGNFIAFLVDGIFVLFDKNGQLLWEKQLAGKLHGFNGITKVITISPNDDYVALTGLDSQYFKTYCYKINGEILWEKNDIGIVQFLNDGSKLIQFSGRNNKNYFDILETSSGTILFSIDLSSLPKEASYIRNIFITANDNAIVLSSYDKTTTIIKFFSKTGDFNYKIINKKLNYQEQSAILDNNMLILSLDGKAHIYAIRPEDK